MKMTFIEFLTESAFKVGDRVKTPEGTGVITELGRGDTPKKMGGRAICVVELDDGPRRTFDMKELRAPGKMNPVAKRDPNWSTLQAKRQSGAMGAHKNPKRDLTVGKPKHRGREMNEAKNHFPGEIGGDIQRAVAKSQLEDTPKFTAPDADGWFKLMNSSLLCDERSDEGASRKSTIMSILKKNGFETKMTSGTLMARKRGMNEDFEVGDPVMVIDKKNSNYKSVGTVKKVYKSGDRKYLVTFGGGELDEFDYNEDELKLDEAV